jgi:hypothetical protein
MGDMKDAEIGSLSELLNTAPENDSLLRQAIQRVRDEAEGASVDFFKHGQFGSHNS